MSFWEQGVASSNLAVPIAENGLVELISATARRGRGDAKSSSSTAAPGPPATTQDAVVDYIEG
jgi:hypothetical protein